MKRTGNCKAYQVSHFREFGGWIENVQNLRPSAAAKNDKEERPARTLGADDILYLHEDYRVTDDIFIDEHVVFDDITPEWRDFCRTVLSFDPVPTSFVSPESRPAAK